MNRLRRKELAKALEMLQNAHEIIEMMKDEEQEAFDNLPEGIQYSERGEQMEETIYNLECMLDEISDNVDTLDEIING